MAEPWEFPLIIRKGSGKFVVSGAEEALRLLDAIPLGARGYLFNLGKRRCEQNLAGSASDGSAQLAFQAALQEAGLFPPTV